jgi:hypothetical protein
VKAHPEKSGRAFTSPTLTMIELKKSFPSKIKKYTTTQTNTTKAEKDSIYNSLQGHRTRTTGYNIGFARERVKSFVSTILLNLKFGSSIER